MPSIAVYAAVLWAFAVGVQYVSQGEVPLGEGREGDGSA